MMTDGMVNQLCNAAHCTAAPDSFTEGWHKDMGSYYMMGAVRAIDVGGILREK